MRKSDLKLGMWTRGLIPAILAAILAIILAFHRLIPNSGGNFGSLVETFLPWFGWGILPLILWAALQRSALALVVLIAPIFVWTNMYAELIPDKSLDGHDIRVVTHNVDVHNEDIPGTAKILIASNADVIALQELNEEGLTAYQNELANDYPNTVQYGTVSLWSKHTIVESTPVDINIGWTRAMRVHIDFGNQAVAFYTAHLASVRVESEGFTSQQRDDTAAALGEAITKEELPRVVLLGDLNGTMQDRSLAPITHQLASTQAVAGSGFGFTWPASFPMARIDQILVRNVTPVRSWALDRTGSDHLPIAADLRL